MSEIRHKGPLRGQVVDYQSGATTSIPSIITAVNSDGTVSLTTFPVGQAPGTASNVPHDFKGTVTPSWRWSEDL